MMLDEAGMKVMWQQLNDLWVQPEVNRRREAGILPDEFLIQQCLIKLPQDSSPIIEFNDEIYFEVRGRLPDGVTKELGQDIYLHELSQIENAQPPKVNGKRVAFIFIYWDGQAHSIVVDFSPNLPDFEEGGEFELGEYLAGIIQQKIITSVVRMSRGSQAQLSQIGLWPVTSLLPFPISKIIERISQDEADEARAILVQYCNGGFIEKLVETWNPIIEFKVRMRLFREATFAHIEKKYHLSIYTLIPQVEGVIADWLYAKFPPEQVKYRLESRVSQFRDVINAIPDFHIAYREALLAVAEFMLDDSSGPLQKFEKWLDSVDPAFPSRHAMAHGKYLEEIITEENSVKLFLLLDTICQFMMFYEAKNQQGAQP